MSLKKIQTEFIKAIKNASPKENLFIYRNNVTAQFANVLKETYPLIHLLLGTAFFQTIAHDYIAEYPSTSSNLHDYGAHFGSFLATLPSISQYPYLTEVAQFEWTCHQLFFAANHSELNIVHLNNIAPERYPELHFVLHPASQLIQFHFPILKIIDLCQGHIDQIMDLYEGGVNLLIIRRELDIMLVPLFLSEFTFLKSLQDNLSLSAALNSAICIDADFNLAKKLPLWIKNKTIVDYYFYR